MITVACSPRQCPNKDMRHDDDLGMERHGSPERPIAIYETRDRRYVDREYLEVAGTVSPYHVCRQSLHRDLERDLDRIVVRDCSGKHHVFWFDVTRAMSERRREAEKGYADYLAGRPVPREIDDAIKAAERLKAEASRWTKNGSPLDPPGGA